MTIQRLRNLISEEFTAVDCLINQYTQTDIPLINEITKHIIGGGGKRLRPMILLLASKACNYKGDHDINLAAAIEILHTATLLHDDVVDESKLRRGKKTSNEIWGSKVSVLTGDYLLSQQMILVIKTQNLDVFSLFCDIINQTTRGEIIQLVNRHNPHPSEQEYFDVIRSKTSMFFAASACLPGIIAKVDKDIETNLYNYGLHLGNAFQLIDDALDYNGNIDAIGKNIGDDLADGIATLPLIHAYKNGTPKQKEIIKNSIEQGSLDHILEIKEAINQTNAIAYTKQVAKSEVNKAIDSLKCLPDSIYKEALTEIATFSLERSE